METQEQVRAALPINDPRAIEKLLEMKSIAVVGLSSDPMRDSYRVSEYMANQGYEIIPVNPTVRSVFGRPSFPTLSAAGRPIEMVNVFRRPEFVAGIVDEAIAVGAKGIWLQYGVIDHEAAERARQAGLLVAMDRCLKVEHMRNRFRIERTDRQKRAAEAEGR